MVLFFENLHTGIEKLPLNNLKIQMLTLCHANSLMDWKLLQLTSWVDSNSQ